MKAAKSLPVDLVDDAALARLALSPLRRRLLQRLHEPASAVQLAAELGMPRQKLGYHLRKLEQAELIAVAEERPRRGFMEKLYVARADALILDPSLMEPPRDPGAVEKQDRHAAEYLVRAAAGIVRDVTRMRAAAEREGTRLLTFTIEADMSFGRPQDIDAFARKLTKAVTRLAKEFEPASGTGRRYRITIGGHPAAGDVDTPKVN